MNKHSEKSTDESRDELKHLAPQLHEMNRKDGFIVPHNYFKTLPDRVMARLAEEEQRQPVWKAWWISLWQQRMALALASVAMLIAAALWVTWSSPEPSPTLTISEEDALQYVLANLEDFNSEDLAAFQGAWEPESLINVSDENIDEMLDEVLQSGDASDIEDLF